jgi:hypothetical protein
VLLSCLPFAGCSRDGLLRFYGYDRASLLKKNMPGDDEALARDCVDLLRQNRFDEIEARLDPSVRSDDIREKLEEMSSLFPSKPISVKPVEAGIVRGPGFSVTSITLEYQFQQSWLLAHVVIRQKAGAKAITEFRITPTAEPFEVMNEFTFRDKGLSQYMGLLLALCVLALTLYAFVLCAITKIGDTKWLWLVAMLVGVCRITVNWTTGEWSFTPLSFFLPLPVNLSFSAYGPWMLQIFSPVGAIAFLRLRKRLALETMPVSIVPHEGSADAGSAQD